MIDLWGWRWCTLDGTKCKQDSAAVFQLFVRCPESILQDLLRASGTNGIYWEPRQSTGMGPHPDFALIWLTGSSYKQAYHIARTDEKVIGLARLGNRIGLRTYEKHGEAVHLKYCPQKPYLKGNIAFVFKIEPLPYGTQRQSLADILRDWGWSAKPLQAVRGSQGRAWEIGATSKPPAEILQTQHGYLTITLMKDFAATSSPQQIVATQRTKKQIHQDATTNVDSPWGSEGDPWSQWLKKAASSSSTSTPPAALTPGAAQSKILEVEKRLQTDVQRQVREQMQEISRDVDMAKQQTETNKGWQPWNPTLGNSNNKAKDLRHTLHRHSNKQNNNNNRAFWPYKHRHNSSKSSTSQCNRPCINAQSRSDNSNWACKA